VAALSNPNIAFAAEGDVPAKLQADKQWEGNVEPPPRLSERWAYSPATTPGTCAAASSGKQQADAGANFWAHPDVVVKADCQWQDNDDGGNPNGFNGRRLPVLTINRRALRGICY
jgi:hypothetical protein